MAEYEARITIYRNGRRLTFSDAHGDSPSYALYAAHNDLERELDIYELAHAKEFETMRADRTIEMEGER